MYLPPAFAEDRLEVRHGLLRAFPLGTLILSDDSGITADMVPFMLYPEEGSHGLGLLRAHVARANPLWRKLAGSPQCLVLFHGPEEYVSPTWYATKKITHKVVPTWNYATVQARGAGRVVDEARWLRRQLDDLTAAQESRSPVPWELDDAPVDFLAATMKGIIGLEIDIASLVGKWKVSQNRSTEDQRGVVDGLLAQQPPAEAMAALVREHIAAEK